MRLPNRALTVVMAIFVLVVPAATHAQQPAPPVIGFLGTSTAAAWAGYVAGFRQGLSEAGYVDGGNVTIEFRWAEDRSDRLAPLAADFVSRQVTVIVTSAGTALALAAKAATPTIPIVFVIGADPVKFGLVASLGRPGGNLTGVSFLFNVLVSKRLQVLHELVPTARSIGVLINPNNPNAVSDTKDVEAAARALRLQTHVVTDRTTRDLDTAFATLAEQRVGALLVAPDLLFVSARDRLVELAARYSLPTIYDRRELVSAGGLISYGPDMTDAHRRAGIYAGRILKGAKPADLPVLQPTEFQLIINLKTAKALGLTIPASVRARADHVIE